MMEREQSGVKLFYDSTKRDPQFAQGEYSFLNELYLLEKHYHPSVQRMAKFILDNYNKDIISYNGEHHQQIINYGTKINPNLERNRTFLGDMGVEYKYKYPFADRNAHLYLTALQAVPFSANSLT